jgi:homocysteine S-methyltransferase
VHPSPDDRLAAKAHWVLDGGLASELEARGADLSDRLWSARLLVEDPELIRQIHLDYFAAGADVAISASYQATFEGFAERGFDHDSAAASMRLAIELARSAAAEHHERHPSDPAPLVAASVGPYGAMLADGSEYLGRYGRSVLELGQFHRPRLETLLEAEPDLLAIETVPAIEEADAILGVLEDLPGAQAWISFSCRDGERINDGTPFVDAVRLASSSDRVIAVGLNCTPPAFAAELLRRAARVATKPLLAYPNEGAVWDATSRSWTLGPDARPDFGALARTWREAGARMIGGCCGTGPQDVAAIARTLAAPSLAP